MRTFTDLLKLLIIFVPHLLPAWEKTYGKEGDDQGMCVRALPDRNFIVTGSFSDSLKGECIWLLKTDSLGDTLWTKKYFEEGEGYGISVFPSTKGGYDIAGVVNDRFSFLETDSFGKILARHSYVDAIPLSAIKTSDSGYIVTGFTQPEGNDLWMAKIDSELNMTWSKSFGSSAASEWGYGVSETKDGGYIATGFIYESPSLKEDLWLLKVNSSGNSIWSRTYGGDHDDWGKCVIQDHDDGYIVAGITGSIGAGSWDLWLLKTDESGDTLWSKTYGASSDDRPNWIEKTNDGGFVITGTSYFLSYKDNDVWLVKFSNSCEKQWSQRIGSSLYDEGNYVMQTHDGGYIVAGNSLIPSKGMDIYIVKTDREGDPYKQSIVENPSSRPGGNMSINSTGQNIIIDFADIPNGLHASVYDAGGRKLDEIHSCETSGQVIWKGLELNSGVFFIKTISDRPSVFKVVLIR